MEKEIEFTLIFENNNSRSKGQKNSLNGNNMIGIAIKSRNLLFIRPTQFPKGCRIGSVGANRAIFHLYVCTTLIYSLLPVLCKFSVHLYIHVYRTMRLQPIDLGVRRPMCIIKEITRIYLRTNCNK